MIRLSTLMTPWITIPQDADRDVVRLSLDNRMIQPGDTFVALQGTRVDGRQYIPAAIAQGANAVIAEASDRSIAVTYQSGVPIIPIANLNAHLGEIAAIFYGHPVNALRLIGVTGTNGKTSCTHFLAQLLSTPSAPCGVIGTLGSGCYGALGEAALTTPDALTLQRLLRDFVNQAAEIAVMEVSSHSIDQERIAGIPFDVGIFTNLTQDHLDYHGTMDAYAAVKRRYLASALTRQLIMNADDPRGRQWITELASQKPVFAYACQLSEKESSKLNVPLFYTKAVERSLSGMNALVCTPFGDAELSIPLIGQFNLSNALAVLAALCCFGVPFTEAVARMSWLRPVPGRMQALRYTGKPLMVIDYAHTPDALQKALEALRAHTAGKLVCVFGCGGDRDVGKRPLMAKIAETLADRVIVTNDNPRHEKPDEIIDQIMQGFAYPERVLIEPDRSKAIQNSIQYSTAADCVLVAGKGAERYQQVGDEKRHFDDVEEAARYLS